MPKTVIHMITAVVPFENLRGNIAGNRTREFTAAVKDSFTALSLPVVQVFGKGAGVENLPTMMPDGSCADSTYVSATIGVEIDASPEEIEAVCENLQVPGFPATAWKFAEN